MKKMRNQKGITLVALVVTIIVLIILSGISINLLLGKNGLITKAQEAKKQQKIAEIKEKISLELSAAETDAIIRNESLEEEQLNDIVSKYGTLQDDKDTILTKDDNYEISLKEIWYGTLSTSGSYSDKKKRIELLEKELQELQEKYNELEKINSGNSEVLNDLRNKITTLENEKKTLEDSLKAEQDKNKTLEAQIADLNNKYNNLKKEYDKFYNDPGTATADNISEGKTAWVNGELITGTGVDNTTSYNKGAEDTAVAKQIKLTELICSNNRSDQCGKYDLTLDISQYKKMSVVGGGYSGSSPTFQCVIYLDGKSYSTALNPKLTDIDISNNSTFRLYLYCYTGTGGGYIKINSITFE